MNVSLWVCKLAENRQEVSTIRPSTNLKSKPFIISDSNSFIGDVLDIPPLLDKLRAMHGKISEEQVIAVASKLYETYNRIFLHDKEKWHEIKSDKIKWSDGTYRTINGCKNALKRLLKNYENEKYNSWLPNGNIRYSFSLDNIFLGNKSIDNPEDALLT